MGGRAVTVFADSFDCGHGAIVYADELSESFIRAAGPGGQNVNKVATSVQLRFNVHDARGLSEPVKRRLLALAGRRAAKDGTIVIEAMRFRTQERNRADARERLVALVTKAATPPPPPRRKTKPSKGAVERRLKAKAGRGQVKRMRGKPAGDE